MSTQHVLLATRGGNARESPPWELRPWRWDRWTQGAWVTAVSVVGLAVVVAATTGSWGIPHADAWSFQKTALTFFHTGHLRLNGWGQMFLLGQIVSAVPLLAAFGATGATLNLYGAVAGLALLYLSFAVARPIVGRRRAFAVLLTVSVFPAFGVLASSFMTDLPCTATAMLCIVVGAAAIRRESLALLALSVLVGVWAFTIREQSVAGLFAVLVTALAFPNLTRRFRIGAASAGVATLLICLRLEPLRHAMPNADVPPWHLSTIRVDHVPPSLPPALFTVGFALAPLAVWAVATLRPREWLAPGRVVGWVAGGLMVAYVAHIRGAFYLTLPNYLNRHGAYAAGAVGVPPIIFGTVAWQAIQAVAAFGGVVLSGEVGQALSQPRAAIRRLRAADPVAAVVACYGVASVLGIIVLSFAGQPQFDRYYVTLVVPLGILLVRRPMLLKRMRPLAIAACGLAFAALAIVCWNITVSTNARDAARWAAAATLARTGVPADEINAGVEWNGIHSSVPADASNKLGLGRPTHYTGQYWTKVFDRSNDCWVVSMSILHLAHAFLVETRPVYPYDLLLRTEHVYVYERRGCAGSFRSRPR